MSVGNDISCQPEYRAMTVPLVTTADVGADVTKLVQEGKIHMNKCIETRERAGPGNLHRTLSGVSA